MSLRYSNILFLHRLSYKSVYDFTLRTYNHIISSYPRKSLGKGGWDTEHSSYGDTRKWTLKLCCKEF